MSKFEQGFLGPKKVTKRDVVPALLGAGLGLILAGSVFAPEGKKKLMEKTTSSAGVSDDVSPDAASMKRRTPQKSRPLIIKESSLEREDEQEKEDERKAIFDAIEGSVKGQLEEIVRNAMRDPRRSDENREKLREYCAAEIAGMRFERNEDVFAIHAPGYENDPEYVATFSVLDAEEALDAWQRDHDEFVEPMLKMHVPAIDMYKPSEQDIANDVSFVLQKHPQGEQSLHAAYDSVFLENIGRSVAIDIFEICALSTKHAMPEPENEEGD